MKHGGYLKIPAIQEHNEEDQVEFECALCKFEERQLESKMIDEWKGFDLRIACQHFDIFEVGCFGCKHYSEGRGHIGHDYRLTCPLEQEYNRRNQNGKERQKSRNV